MDIMSWRRRGRLAPPARPCAIAYKNTGWAKAEGLLSSVHFHHCEPRFFADPSTSPVWHGRCVSDCRCVRSARRIPALAPRGTWSSVLVAQGADWIDLDGPLLLAQDREPRLRYE